MEWSVFSDDLTADNAKLLHSRIERLCALLANPSRSSRTLSPLALGYLQSGPTKLCLIYRLPQFADPRREELSLYAILYSNKRSMPNTKRRLLLPTLEEKYLLATVLAEGLISLINVK